MKPFCSPVSVATSSAFLSRTGEPRGLSYADKLRDGRWKKRQHEIEAAAGYKCEECQGTHDLTVHHVFYLPGKDPWDYPDALLICLCWECHQKRQQVELDIYTNIATILRYKSMDELKEQPIYAFFKDGET